MPGNNSQANLSMLESVAKQLAELKDEFIFLGGCTTALFITDHASPDVRYTVDVDCIVDVISLSHYHQLARQLNNKGFKQSAEDEIICRWRYNDMILDVMPTDEKILGFSNRWYKAAKQNVVRHEIGEDLYIKSVTAPYFLVTKLEAFRQRGKNDFLSSHDLEDIISVIDGRPEIVTEVNSDDLELREYLNKVFTDMLKNENFHANLPGHLNYGPISSDRARIVLERIVKMCAI